MAEQLVLVDVREGVGTVAINRPDVMNAMNFDTMAAIIASFQQLGQRDDVRVVILRGAGDKAFCAGRELTDVAYYLLHREVVREIERTGTVIGTILTCPKPTIAAVRGYVRGGGSYLLASCDIVIAADDATLAIPQMNFGQFEIDPMVPVMRRIGRSKMLDLYLTCDVIDAVEAQGIGFFDRVVPVEQFDETVAEVARKIASRDPQAIRAGKDALDLLIDQHTMKQLKAAVNAMIVFQFSRDPKKAAAQIHKHLESVQARRS
ncbi:MAG: enoyl-CoA hydratase/isomerase family protein [Chloroflexi bacterium]|nr:enoyl-CoA hydratase/isomerase family protein [Chloroflexota bacterium]